MHFISSVILFLNYWVAICVCDSFNRYWLLVWRQWPWGREWLGVGVSEPAKSDLHRLAPRGTEQQEQRWPSVWIQNIVYTINKRWRGMEGGGRGIWLSGKTFDCRPRDCEFDPPSLQLKLLKEMYVLVLPRKNAPVYQCFTLGMLKNLGYLVWWARQYLALWVTNRNKLYICMPRRRMGKARVRR